MLTPGAGIVPAASWRDLSEMARAGKNDRRDDSHMDYNPRSTFTLSMRPASARCYERTRMSSRTSITASSEGWNDDRIRVVRLLAWRIGNDLDARRCPVRDLRAWEKLLINLPLVRASGLAIALGTCLAAAIVS